MIKIAPSVSSVYPGAQFGVMVVNGLRSDTGRSIMDRMISEEIAHIKLTHADYERKSALETAPLCHYTAYYKRFKKTYPVLGQLESILLKGKGIPPVGAPIEAMFLAEVKNLLLTAGHDLDLVEGGLVVDVASEPKSYTGISGREQQLVNGDLYLRDEQGILSSIINGPDARTKITGATQSALYFAYGVDGITEEQITEHLQGISGYLSQAIAGVAIQSLTVF